MVRKELAGSQHYCFIKYLPALMVAAAALQVTSKLWGVKWFQSHEEELYPIRLVEYVQSFKCGSFFPRWCPDLYGGYGYPLFNYYQPGLFATAAAIMALLATTPIGALKFAIAAFALAGGYGVYRLIYGETRRSDAALMGGIVFVYLPYRITDLYLRGDLGEFAAYCLVPLVLWGYRELGRAESVKAPLVGTLTAFCHAATLFCHVIIGLYTSEIVCIMLLISVLRSQGNIRRRALLGWCVVILAIGIAAVYIGPAWFERGLVSLDKIHTGTFFAANNLISPRRVLFEFGFVNIGLAPVAGAIAAATSFVLPRVRRNATLVIGWWLPAVLMALLILQFGWAQWFWSWLPLGSYIQYPWRLLGFIGLFSAVGIGVTWALVFPEKWRVFRWLGAISFSLAIAHIEQPYMHFMFDPGGTLDVPDTLMTPTGIRSHFPFPYTTASVNEYLPLKAQPMPLLPRMAGRVTASDGTQIRFSQPCPLRYSIEAQAAQPSELNLHVFDFPGWKAETLDGPAQAKHVTSKEGLIQLYLPTPGKYRIEVYFGLTPFRVLASAITLGALLLAYPILWELNRRPRAPYRSDATVIRRKSPT